MDAVVHGEDFAEKGETDSFCKEHILSESEDEKEAEAPNMEKENGSTSNEDFFEDKQTRDRQMPISESVSRDPGLKITHSLTFDNFGLTSPRVVFERCHEAPLGGTVCSVIAVTTTEVRCMGPNMRLEISEVLTSDDSNFKTTVTLQNDSGEETHFTSRTEKHQNSKNPQIYSWTQHGAQQNVSYKISIAELNAESACASKSQSSWDDPEEVACRKSCCKNNFHWGGQTDTDFTLVDGSSRCSSLSDLWQRQKQPSLPTSLSNEALWDIPPPEEFADGNSCAMDVLSENVASCQISSREKFNNQDNINCTQKASEVTLCKMELLRQKTLHENNEPRYCEGLSDAIHQEHLFMSPRVSINRSSFTKNFINNHERKTRLRNNSIATLETQTHPAGYMDIPPKRRKTFPGVSYLMSQARDSIPSYRESFSSGTLSSFFMQSLPCQTEKMGRFFAEDERLCLVGSRKSSSSSSYRPSSSSTTGPDSFGPKCRAYSTIKNPFYPSRSDESPEEVFFRGEQYHEQEQLVEPSSEADVGMMFTDLDSTSGGQPELNEVSESGFDEEMVELDESISAGNTIDSHQKELLIHVIPPSLSNSEEKINEGVHYSLKHNTFDGDKTDDLMRRASVISINSGGNEQRFLQGNYVFSLDGDVSPDALSPVSESPTGPPIDDLGSIREVVEELQDSSQAPKTTTVQMNMSSQQPNATMDKISRDVCRTPKVYKNDLSERPNSSKSKY